MVHVWLVGSLTTIACAPTNRNGTVQTVKKVGSLAATERCTILLFYHYVRPAAMSFQRTEQLKDFLEQVTTEITLGGRIRSVGQSDPLTMFDCGGCREPPSASWCRR